MEITYKKGFIKLKYIVMCFLFIIIFLILFWATAIFRLPLQKKKVSIQGKEMLVWLAEKTEDKERGLQNIIWLPKNSGMLFVFDRPGQYCFWNKNTLRSLKLIFMRNGEITEEVSLQPIWKGKQSICPVYDADSVLEVLN